MWYTIMLGNSRSVLTDELIASPGFPLLEAGGLVGWGSEGEIWVSIFLSPSFVVLELNAEPTLASVKRRKERNTWRRKRGTKRGRIRKTARALALLLSCMNKQIHTATAGAGFLRASVLPSPQLALISPGISPSRKSLPLRSKFSCPLLSLLIRGC